MSLVSSLPVLPTRRLGQCLLVSTVETHVAHIFTKLAIHTRAGLAARGVQHEQPVSAADQQR